MTNERNTVLYTGVTNDLERRIGEHRGLLNPGSFTCRYSVKKLVYYEAFWDIRDAIARKKQIKGGSRKKKIELIEKTNSTWKDLANGIK